MRPFYLATIFLLSIHTHAVGAKPSPPDISENAGEAPAEIIGAKTINTIQALQLFSQGAVFIDVRSQEVWQQGHITGSVHLDVNTNDFMVLYLSEKLDRETNLVFYGDSPLSVRSALASFFAGSWGYSNVHYFRDGYFAWMAADLPMTMLDATIPDSHSTSVAKKQSNKTQQELLSDKGVR